MPNILLKQKNVFIVPLSLFIKFNKHPRISIDDLLNIDEEKEVLKNFSTQLQAILQSQLVADFNLGKYTSHQFLIELLKFIGLAKNLNESNPERIEILKNVIKSAWNSLIEFNSKSSELFNTLIKLIHQGKSIYFVGNTNALHAQKILFNFIIFPFNQVYVQFLEKLPQNIPAEPLAISTLSDTIADHVLAQNHGTIYLCLSYFYEALIKSPQNLITTLFKPAPSSLLSQLKNYLHSIDKTRDDIIFVTSSKKSINREFDLDTIKEKDFCTLLKNSATAVTAFTS